MADRFGEAERWATSLVGVEGVITAMLDRGDDGRRRVAVFLDCSCAELGQELPTVIHGVPVHVYENYVFVLSPETGRPTLRPR
jgi:hypothetical protein